jgi:hypothetical protein
MLLLAALSAGLALQAEAPAAATPPAAVPSTTAPKPADARKLKCEKLTLIGSRMPVRVCRTPEQIKQAEANARDTTVDFQKINPEAISK